MTTLCYCDGGCLGNGTQNATVYGSYKIGAMQVQRITHGEQAHTNNEGEYLTLIATLEAIKAHGIKDALIRCDSVLVVNQVVGHWKVKEPRLMPLRDRARELIAETGAAMEWVRRDEIEAVLGH